MYNTQTFSMSKISCVVENRTILHLPVVGTSMRVFNVHAKPPALDFMADPVPISAPMWQLRVRSAIYLWASTDPEGFLESAQGNIPAAKATQVLLDLWNEEMTRSMNLMAPARSPGGLGHPDTQGRPRASPLTAAGPLSWRLGWQWLSQAGPPRKGLRLEGWGL